MRALFVLFTIFWLLGVARPATAHSVGVGSPVVDGRRQPITFEWALGELSPAEAQRLLEGERWLDARHGQGSFSLGYHARPLWLRLSVVNTGADPVERVLVLTNPLIDQIEARLATPGVVQGSTRLGTGVSGSAGGEATLLRGLVLTLPPGETRVLLRLQARSALATRLELLSRSEWSRANTTHALKAGVVLAVQLGASFAALVVGLFLGSPLWLAFAACTASSGVTFAYVMGYLDWWLGPGAARWGDALGAVAFAVALLAGSVFCARALRLHKHHRQWTQLSFFAFAAALLAAFGILIAGWPQIALPSMLWLAVLVSLFFLGLLIGYRRRGLPLGWLLGAGLSLYLIASVMRFLRSLGHLPSAWWTEELHEFFSIVYLAMIQTGIALQTREILSDRDRLSGQLLAERESREAERDLLAMLSHELRTPLATIDAATSVLREVATLDGGARASRLDKIQRSVSRIRSLFDRHLIGPGMQEDWHRPQLEPLDLRELLRRIVEEWQRDWRGHPLRLVLPEHAAEIVADRSLVTIAVGNLLDNARKFGPSHEVIELSLHLDGVHWRIAVDDRGEPLPSAETEVIFDRYVRGTQSAAKPGAGLGLFVVRRVAELHRGRAGFERLDGGGNRFWMALLADA